MNVLWPPNLWEPNLWRPDLWTCDRLAPKIAEAVGTATGRGGAAATGTAIAATTGTAGGNKTLGAGAEGGYGEARGAQAMAWMAKGRQFAVEGPKQSRNHPLAKLIRQLIDRALDELGDQASFDKVLDFILRIEP